MPRQPSVIGRAQADIAAGELWRARDRLNGSWKNSPTNFEVVEVLGEVYMRMGDLPAAGRWWYLSAVDDERHDAARAAYEARHGGRAEQIRAGLPRLAIDTPIPDGVRTRLDLIGGQPPPRVVANDAPHDDGLLVHLGILLFLLATVGVWFAGLGWLLSLVL